MVEDISCLVYCIGEFSFLPSVLGFYLETSSLIAFLMEKDSECLSLTS